MVLTLWLRLMGLNEIFHYFEIKSQNLTQKTTPQLTIRQTGYSSPALPLRFRDVALWLALPFGQRRITGIKTPFACGSLRPPLTSSSPALFRSLDNNNEILVSVAPRGAQGFASGKFFLREKLHLIPMLYAIDFSIICALLMRNETLFDSALL